MTRTERYRKDYDAGLNDVEIASKHGVRSQSVYLWRTKNNLEVNGTRRPRRPRGSVRDAIARFVAKNPSSTDGMVATACGCSAGQVIAWRERHQHHVRAFRNRESKRAGA